MKHRALLALLLVAPASLPAQTQLADSLWAAENYTDARAEYTRVLHADPGSVRALYRLAILNAWDNRLDSALALLQDAREIEPRDPDVRVWEATVFSWKGRLGDALVRYDSVIAEFPDRSDARLGRARTLAWAGRQREADRAYREIVAANPRDAEALFGLAQLRLRQDRLAEADHYNSLAFRVAPHDRATRELQQQIAALRHPRLDVTLGMSHDSDDNDTWWQNAGTTLVMGPGLRGFGSVGAFEVNDPNLHGSRLSAEIGGTWNHGDLGVTGAVGVRSLNPGAGANRGLGTVRLSAAYRLSPSAGGGIGYARYSFDDTAFLLANRIDIDEFSADGDVELRRDLTLGGGLQRADFSDGNHRTSVALSLNQEVGDRFNVGLYGRRLWYKFHGVGYFSPNPFVLGEVRGGYTQTISRWSARVSGGLGVQNAGPGAGTDGEWHIEVRVARRWAAINEIGFQGGITNNTISSATGAYHLYSAGITARIGL